MPAARTLPNSVTGTPLGRRLCYGLHMRRSASPNAASLNHHSPPRRRPDRLATPTGASWTS